MLVFAFMEQAVGAKLHLSAQLVNFLFMNFLAHLHIADCCESSLIGNLLGDFVKGDPYRQYPKSVADGIKLHRFVDSFTDAHPAMKQGKMYFPVELRRFAPIALDLFWDHCLAEGWDSYSSTSLAAFCLMAEKQTRTAKFALPESYKVVSKRMWDHHWLTSYCELNTLEVALERMSMRSERMFRLSRCFEVLNQNYSELKALFPLLYKEVIDDASRFARNGYSY